MKEPEKHLNSINYHIVIMSGNGNTSIHYFSLDSNGSHYSYDLGKKNIGFEGFRICVIIDRENLLRIVLDGNQH